MAYLGRPWYPKIIEYWVWVLGIHPNPIPKPKILKIPNTQTQYSTQILKNFEYLKFKN